MAAEPRSMSMIKILHKCQVSPPPDSVAPTHLPLTFFDVPWLLCAPMQRLFFYHYPHPTHHFTLSTLPNLKLSLSTALRHFFPFAASLVCPPPPDKPYLLYSRDGSVSFTAAESAADFNTLISDQPREVTDSHPLVPELPRTARLSPRGGATHVIPLLAVQVTVFPNSGISVGATFNHVVADGRTFHNFVKSWALLCKAGLGSEALACLPATSLPIHDRGAIKDAYKVEPVFLENWWSWALNSKPDVGLGLDRALLRDKVRATLVVRRPHIERLKLLVSAQSQSRPQAWRATTFVVTCAFLWVHLVRSQGAGDGDAICHLAFLVDCRNRKCNVSEYPIPATYFGNCLAVWYVAVKRDKLVGERGVFEAAKAIGKRIKEMEGGALVGADKWLEKSREISELGNKVVIAASPNLRVYDTDFGWGRPKKSQVVHIDATGAVSLSECRDEQGGVEIGLALERDKMDSFLNFFNMGLKFADERNHN